MLLLAPPPASPLAAAAFPDHADARVLYYLPPALAVAEASAQAGGGPDLLLLRYRGEGSAAAGGLLRFRLVLADLDPAALAAATAAGWEPREVSFDAARFRLVLRASLPGEADHSVDQAGDWKPAETAGRELAAPAAGLSAHEAELLANLLAGDGRNVLEVEAEMLYRGLVPGLPWLATADTAALRAALAGLLPDGPARADQVAAAFLSLPDPGPLAWRPLDANPGGSAPARDALLAETAARALETAALFRAGAADPAPSPWEPRTYRLVPAAAGEPASLAWDLAVPRQEARRHALSWSITGLLQGLDDEARRRVFPAVPDGSPFAAFDVHVVNQLPLDPAYLRKLAVDVRAPGPAGVPETHSFVFAEGGTSVARFASFHPAIGPLSLDVRLTATLAPAGGAGWPRVLSRNWTPGTGEPFVTVDRRAAGIDFVRVEAEPEVFARASAIDVAILPATAGSDAAPTAALASLTLIQASPAAWVALPGIDPESPLTARAVAHPPAGVEAEPLALFAGPLADRALRLAAWQLEVLAPERVAIVLPAETAARFPYVAVTVSAGEGAPEAVHTLDAGTPWTWSFFRASVFAPVRFRYRLDYVALDGDGRPLPIARTAWTDAAGTALTVAPPIPTPAVDPTPAPAQI